MKKSVTKSVVIGLALAGVLFASASSSSAQFADSVVDYAPGTGYAVGFTNANTALGTPTDSHLFGPVTPLDPAWETHQVVSIGAGGSLTLEFNTPISNEPAGSLWGLDFVVFGNEGFVDTNWPSGMTDGQLLNQTFGVPGTSRVLVSEDGAQFYALQIPASLSAAVDLLFPADSAGTIGLPVNPFLTNDDFAGLDLAGIRQLYAGSAGGTGFDLGWAVDGNNEPVTLTSARYIRIEVIDSKVEVDAVAIVPEPTTLNLVSLAAIVVAVRRRRRN